MTTVALQYAYLVHGLRIASTWPFPIGVVVDESRGGPFGVSGGVPDVVVEHVDLASHGSSTDPPGDAGWYAFEGDTHTFGWSGVGTFRISEGRRVEIEPDPRVGGVVAHVLAGPILADILQSKGRIALHANVNRIGDGAVALMGPSGRGKSTLSAMLAVRGCPLHADDLAGPEIRDGLVVVPRGIPRLKLHPDIVARMGLQVDALQPVFEGAPKYAQVEDWRRTPTELPLSGLYHVEDGPEVRIEPVATHHALFMLFANLFRIEVQQHAGGAASLLRRCARLLERVPMYRLVRPRDLDMVDRVVACLQEHAGV